MKPRYKPTWVEHIEDWEDQISDTLIGQVGPFDVWYDKAEQDVTLVGPPDRQIEEDSPHNFDTFNLESGLLNRADQKIDLHVYPHEISELYALCIAQGILPEP